MFVKVVASPSGTKFQHRIHGSPVTRGPHRSTSGSFGGTPSTVIAHPKKRSVVSSSSQLKFTALAQMAEARARAAAGTSSASTVADTTDGRGTPGAGEALIAPPTTIRKSESMQNVRRAVRRVRDNHCCVALFFLFFGIGFNIISYWISVQSAQLNSEAIDAAVANHELSLKSGLRKILVSGPSKYIIGLFSFLARVTSAVGTFFLAQAVVTWLQKRRSQTLRSAAGHADEAIGEVHGGCAEIVADCWANCIPAFG